MTNDKKFRSKSLACGCCGCGFSTWEGYVDQDQDKGYGICQSCQEWIQGREEEQFDEMIQMVTEALNEKNSKKFAVMDRDSQKGFCMDMIDDGIIRFQIGSR